MVVKKTKKDPSWDKLGKIVGKKMEKEVKKGDVCCSGDSTFMAHCHGCGGFGRLVFFVGACIAMGYLGWLTIIPWWTLVIAGIGFTLMKF